MEQVVHNYGKFLLEAIVFVAFWLLILSNVRSSSGERGVFHILGTYMKNGQTICETDFACCIEESKRSKPTISYKYGGTVCAGTYDINELFCGLDCEGKEVSLTVQYIWGPERVMDSEAYNQEDERICFQERGMYQMQLCARDRWNNETVCSVCIPVN